MTRRQYIKFLVQTGFLSTFVADSFSKAFIENSTTTYLDIIQFRYLEVLCQTIIPKTNTMGAIEAGVPHFVDLYMRNMVTIDDQKAFLDMFNLYITHLQSLKLNLKRTSKALTTQMTIDEKGNHRIFIKALKTMTLKGFFMNEKALKQYFQYVAVPGNFKADLTKSELGKVWIN
jgi:hypothetical protein